MFLYVPLCSLTKFLYVPLCSLTKFLYVPLCSLTKFLYVPLKRITEENRISTHLIFFWTNLSLPPYLQMYTHGYDIQKQRVQARFTAVRTTKLASRGLTTLSWWKLLWDKHFKLHIHSLKYFFDQFLEREKTVILEKFSASPLLKN